MVTSPLFFFFFSPDIGCEKPSGNLNLLLAAAVAGAQTDEDNSSSDEGDLEPLTFDKAMELWMRHKTPKGEKLFLATSGVKLSGWVGALCVLRVLRVSRDACFDSHEIRDYSKS